MSLASSYSHQDSCQGDATGFGSIEEVVDRIEEFLRITLPKIIGDLKGWDPDKKKRRNEKRLAKDLSLELNFAASNEVFHFEAEDLENESGTRTVDWGLYPTNRLLVQGCASSPKTRLYAIEAKRFRTHETSIDGREREYVVGDWEVKHLACKKLQGGIERIKEGHHASGLQKAGMIAFVQHETPPHWHGKVNEWIDDLITNPIPSHKAAWEAQDKLTSQTSPGAGVTEYDSNHSRADGSSIHLTHFWLDLTAQ